MNKSIVTIVAALLTSLGALSPASASGEQESLELCAATLADHAENIEFKSMRGASTRKLTFEITTPDGVETVICTVRRGEVTALDGLSDAPRFAS